MSLHPSDLRAGDWAYLAEFDWTGRTIRIADREISGVPFGTAGAAVDFQSGLDVGGSVGNELDLFADVPAGESLSVTLDLSRGVDVPAMLRRGYSPVGGELRLYLHPVGSSGRRQVFRGTVQRYEYEAKEDPLTLTARQSLADDVGVTHPPHTRFGSRSLGPNNVTWEWDDQQAESWWPVVIGKPGNGSASADPLAHHYGSPAFGLTLNSGPTAYAGCAGHRTGGGSVFVANFTSGDEGSATVSQTRGINGLEIAVADITAFTPPRWSDGDEMWIDWGASGGGLLKADGSLLRHAGDVLLWLARRSRGVPVDIVRMETSAPHLRQFLVDTSIVPAPGETIAPWDWAEDHLLPLLPVSVARGPDGLFLVVWRPDATATDAAAHINTAAGGNAARSGPVESSSLKEVSNEVTIEYGVDAKTDKPTKRKTITGDPLEIEANDDATQSVHAVRSFGTYGRRAAKPIKTDIIWDDSTALAILRWHSRRFSLPTEATEYRCAAHLAWLEPGHVVTVTDSDLGLKDRVALVEAVNPLDTGIIGVRVRFYAVL